MEHHIAVEPISVPAWTWLAGALALLALYVLMLDNGAVLAQSAHVVHELVHDARHFTGVPCH